MTVFHRPLRRCGAALCAVGAGLAGVSAVLAAARLGAGPALVFAVVAAVLGVLAVAVLRARRWALWIVTVGSAGPNPPRLRPPAGRRAGRWALWMVPVGSAGQIAAVIGTAWELHTGMEATKAAQVRRLGFDPAAGMAMNLVYSVLASLLFAWIAARWWRARRRER